jgi:hypothetical protein
MPRNRDGLCRKRKCVLDGRQENLQLGSQRRTTQTQRIADHRLLIGVDMRPHQAQTIVSPIHGVEPDRAHELGGTGFSCADCRGANGDAAPPIEAQITPGTTAIVDIDQLRVAAPVELASAIIAPNVKTLGDDDYKYGRACSTTRCARAVPARRTTFRPA